MTKMNEKDKAKLISRMLDALQLNLHLSYSSNYACILTDSREVVTVKRLLHHPYYAYQSYFDSVDELLKALLTPHVIITYQLTAICISDRLGTSIEEVLINLDLLESKNNEHHTKHLI